MSRIALFSRLRPAALAVVAALLGTLAGADPAGKSRGHEPAAAAADDTITHRLHAIEARLDPRRFMRLGRGTIANADAVTRVSPMPGGTYLATLSNGQELPVSRIQSRVLRDTRLKL